MSASAAARMLRNGGEYTTPEHVVKLMKQNPDDRTVAEYGAAAVASYAWTNKVDRKKLTRLGAVEAVLNAMQRHKDDVGAVEEACRALASLALDDENQSKIVAAGGIKVVLDVIRRPAADPAAVRLALRAVRNLAVKDENRVKIASLGGIKAVLDAMRQHMHNRGVAEQACTALRNLGIGDKGRSGSLGGIEAVLDAMKQHKNDRGVAESACGALWIFSLDNDNKVKIASLGGIEAVLDAMKQHKNDRDVTKMACAALRNLAANTDNKVKMASLGGIEAVLDAMKQHMHDRGVAESACAVLRNLSANSDNKSRLATPDVIDMLKQLLEMYADDQPFSSLITQLLDHLCADCSDLLWHIDGYDWSTPHWKLDRAFDGQLRWVRVTPPHGDDEHAVFSAPLPPSSPLHAWIAADVHGMGKGGLTLSRVEIVKSAVMLSAFQSRLKQVRAQRGKADGPFNQDFGASDPTKQAMVDMLKGAFVHADKDNVNVLLAWHGCDEAVVDDIVAGGAANLASGNDRGFFGSGICLTRQAPYAAGYSTRLIHGADKWREPNDRGEHVLLLCAVSVGLAYPVSRSKDYGAGSNVCSFKGQPLVRGCDTHYVHVSEASGFQAAEDPRILNFEEVVVDQQAQVLPFAKVYVRVDRSQQVDYLFHSPPVTQVPESS